MNLLVHTGGAFQTNGYLLAKEDGTCIVIDAPAGMAAFLTQHALTPSHLLLTHQHFDHVEDAAALQKLGARIVAHSGYSDVLCLRETIPLLGVDIEVPPFQVDEIVAGSPSLKIGDTHFDLAHIPGHSPDSISFHLVAESFLFSGDALFNRGIGRTDLPGGNHKLLLDSIRQKLYLLPDETAVFPGHGPQTSIGTEKKANPFCPST